MLRSAEVPIVRPAEEQKKAEKETDPAKDRLNAMWLSPVWCPQGCHSPTAVIFQPCSVLMPHMDCKDKMPREA